MKKILILFCFALFINNVDAKPISPYFDDDNFYKCVVNNLNEDNINGINNRDFNNYIATDNELSTLSTLTCVSYNINSLKGLEKLPNITYVDFEDNNVKEIDLTLNPKVIYLYTDENINVIGYDGVIEVSENQLYEDDLSNNNNILIISVILICIIIILIYFFIKKKKKFQFKKENINLNKEKNTLNTNIQTKDLIFNNENVVDNDLLNKKIDETKICPNCGARLKDDAKVCFICGKECKP